jgi:hypothetical protein
MQTRLEKIVAVFTSSREFIEWYYMLYVLSKTVGWFAVATNFIAALGVAGLLLGFTRFHLIGHRLAAASLILFIVIAISPRRQDLGRSVGKPISFHGW